MTVPTDRLADRDRSSSGDLWAASVGYPRVTVLGREWLVVSYEWSDDSTSPVSSDEQLTLDLCLCYPGTNRLKTIRVKRASLIESIIDRVDAQVEQEIRMPRRW